MCFSCQKWKKTIFIFFMDPLQSPSPVGKLTLKKLKTHFSFYLYIYTPKLGVAIILKGFFVFMTHPTVQLGLFHPHPQQLSKGCSWPCVPRRLPQKLIWFQPCGLRWWPWLPPWKSQTLCFWLTFTALFSSAPLFMFPTFALNIQRGHEAEIITLWAWICSSSQARVTSKKSSSQFVLADKGGMRLR